MALDSGFRGNDECGERDAVHRSGERWQMTRLAVGIVGCGGRARGHMQALQQFDDVAMVAVCDPHRGGTRQGW